MMPMIFRSSQSGTHMQERICCIMMLSWAPKRLSRMALAVRIATPSVNTLLTMVREKLMSFSERDAEGWRSLIT